MHTSSKFVELESPGCSDFKALSISFKTQLAVLYLQYFFVHRQGSLYFLFHFSSTIYFESEFPEGFFIFLCSPFFCFFFFCLSNFRGSFQKNDKNEVQIHGHKSLLVKFHWWCGIIMCVLHVFNNKCQIANSK